MPSVIRERFGLLNAKTYLVHYSHLVEKWVVYYFTVRYHYLLKSVCSTGQAKGSHIMKQFHSVAKQTWGLKWIWLMGSGWWSTLPRLKAKRGHSKGYFKVEHGVLLWNSGNKLLQCSSVVDLSTFTGMNRYSPGKGSTLEISMGASLRGAGFESGSAKAEHMQVWINLN